MEDWLGIVLGILFILGPALLEKGSRKKKRGQRHERQLPQQDEVYGPEPVLRPETTESQLPEVRPVYVPVPSEEPMGPREQSPCPQETPLQWTGHDNLFRDTEAEILKFYLHTQQYVKRAYFVFEMCYLHRL